MGAAANGYTKLQMSRQGQRDEAKMKWQLAAVIGATGILLFPAFRWAYRKISNRLARPPEDIIHFSAPPLFDEYPPPRDFKITRDGANKIADEKSKLAYPLATIDPVQAGLLACVFAAISIFLFCAGARIDMENFPISLFAPSAISGVITFYYFRSIQSRRDDLRRKYLAQMGRFMADPIITSPTTPTPEGETQ